MNRLVKYDFNYIIYSRNSRKFIQIKHFHKKTLETFKYIFINIKF